MCWRGKAVGFLTESIKTPTWGYFADIPPFFDTPPTRRGASVPSLGSANNRLTRHNQALAQFPPTEMGHSAPASRRWQ